MLGGILDRYRGGRKIERKAEPFISLSVSCYCRDAAMVHVVAAVIIVVNYNTVVAAVAVALVYVIFCHSCCC